MRRLLIVAAVILLAQFISLTALAQQGESAKPQEQTSQKGLDGHWTGTIKSPQGDQETSADFKKDGDAFTGALSSPQGDLPFKNIKVAGDKVTATADIESPNGNVVINFSFTLKDDTLNGKGEINFNGQNVAFDINLKRGGRQVGFELRVALNLVANCRREPRTFSGIRFFLLASLASLH